MNSTLERTELLRKMPIFGGVRSQSLEMILDASEEVDFSGGDYFFREGEVGQFIFVIETGTAVVERRWGDTPIILGRLKSGDCFGEMSLIDLQRRSASVKAESDCHVIQIPFRALLRLCQSDVEQYTMVMMNLAREVSRRLRIAGERLFRYQQELGLQSFDDELTGDG